MNEVQKELINSVQKFRLNKIEPLMEHDDANSEFRESLFKEMGELGFAGITTSEKYQGLSLNYTDFCLVLEEIAKSSVSYAVTLSVSSMVQSIIQEFGSENQKQDFLPKLALGQSIGSFCLSESHAGSDAASLKTTAKKTKEGYELNGTKMWITSAGLASVYIVMARTGEEGAKGISSFIVPKETKGLTFGKKENKMGWTISPTREVIFDKCIIPHEALLGQEGEGFKIAMSALDRGRITIGAISVGLAQRALEESVKFSLQRQQFNKPIFDFQGLQWMMADMATEIEASKLLVEKAAKLFDSGSFDVKIASMAKMKASDTAMKATCDALQIHGGVGYTKEYPIERFILPKLSAQS